MWYLPRSYRHLWASGINLQRYSRYTSSNGAKFEWMSTFFLLLLTLLIVDSPIPSVVSVGDLRKMPKPWYRRKLHSDALRSNTKNHSGLGCLWHPLLRPFDLPVPFNSIRNLSFCQSQSQPFGFVPSGNALTYPKSRYITLNTSQYHLLPSTCFISSVRFRLTHME